MVAPVKTFWLEASPTSARYLRRLVAFDNRKEKPCPLSFGSHDASLRIDDSADSTSICAKSCLPPELLADPRWPTTCGCGYVFDDSDEKWLVARVLYTRLDTGEVMALSDAPVGALWRATWYEQHYPEFCGRDGLSIMCRTPDGGWNIDGRASNCTNPSDWTHRCWVRHGTFGEELHVDKDGPTCAAGAGSIGKPNWHGFLDRGWLVEDRGADRPAWLDD